MPLPTLDSHRFEFVDLDESTRTYMLDELEQDLRGENGPEAFYLGERLTDRGRSDWPDLLRQAIDHGDPESLADSLQNNERQIRREVQHRKTGDLEVAVNQGAAARLLADGAFNRYYIRAVCRRAIDAGQECVVVYRARQSKNPRPESEDRIGAELRAGRLLADLRADPRVESVLGVPNGPNSGLSVRLVSEPRTLVHELLHEERL